MEILIVRHGDPDYERDTLTYKGIEEARLLAERLAKLEVTDFYCSPLGSSLGTAFIMSVSVMPGATALTRMPLGPSSRARDTVRPLTANLEAG